jgi:hypothetical protein
MLLPDKHIKMSESLLGLGAFLIGLLHRPKTVDDIWFEYRKARDSGEYPSHHTFENLVLALDVLFAITAIKINDNGLIEKCA